jgi:hypothetical protein
VLELGSLVALGPAATVFADQRVIDAYLGLEEGEGDAAQIRTESAVAADGEHDEGGGA